METEKTKYLIIGNSAGGIGAAEAIREVDKEGAIIIVSDETYPAYSRPFISEYLVNSCPLERMLFRPPDFYDDSKIENRLGEQVVHLDINNHTIELEHGGKIIWGKLLLATGSLPIVPEIEGISLKGVFTFTTLGNAKAIDGFINRCGKRRMRAVVIGGGLLGVSASEALAKRGIQVTIVEMKERILNTILDEETAALVGGILRQAGVEIITGHTVSKVTSYLPGEATGVTLDDVSSIPCEMVIVAIGMKPRTELAVHTDIKINRGIIVDRYMATSRPDVYACGDVAEAYDFVYGENRLIPIWPNAYLGGRIAGFNMAGIPTEYQGGTAMNSLKYFGVNIVSAGMVTPPDDSYEVISKKQNHIYKKVVLKDGLIVGMVFAGDVERSGIVYNLMKERVNVDNYKEVLVSDDFGLVSLPEEIWRVRLNMPASGFIPLTSIREQPEELVLGE